MEKKLSFMIYATLMVLALGLLTSTTLLALSHILMVIPGFYFLSKINYKEVSRSSWALLALSLVIILSVVFNQDIAINGFKPISKVKYFLFGFLMIAPFSWYFKNYFEEKKISYLIYAFFFATTLASLAGMGGVVFEYNYVLMQKHNISRNGGLFGMLMNYAHNMVYFQIIVTAMVLYKNDMKKYVDFKILFFVFVINLLGLYMTYTRGAWLGYLVAVPFLFVKKNMKVFACIMIILIVIGTTLHHLAGNVMIRPQSDSQRLSQWKAAAKAFEERPILGYGYLNFETHSIEIKKRYNLGELDFYGHAHNNFFELLGATGILGISAFILWLIFWFIEMYKRDDLIGKIGLPFIIAFIGGGLTQSTISLGINLFFIMAVYAISQIKKELV